MANNLDSFNNSILNIKEIKNQITIDNLYIQSDNKSRCEILENAKEIGMELYLGKIHKLAKMKFVKSKIKSIQKKKSEKTTIKIKLGPNNMHTILDSLEIKH